MGALALSRLKQPGLHAVGGVAGLYLQVTASGARTWILRIKVGAKRRDMGLGGYPDVTLALAREKARASREKVDAGIDPIAERIEAKARLIAMNAKCKSFDEVAAMLIRVKQAEFKNPKHAAQWPSTINRYASPVIGKLPIDQIELGHITRILEPIWATKTETATRLRGRIEAVLDYATVKGWRSAANPARWKGNLDAIMPKPSKLKNVKHHRALPISQMPGFMVDLKEQQGSAARALEFAILTAARSGEVRGARWAEVDLSNGVWTLPAERMKAGREHRVPLSDAARLLLEGMPRWHDTDFIFSSTRGAMLSDMSMIALMRRMNVDAVPHGFRSTFRDWCAERTNYPQHVAEMALAHAIGDKVEAAYRRGDLFVKRQRLMAEWARFCMTPLFDVSVIPLRKANS